MFNSDEAVVQGIGHKLGILAVALVQTNDADFIISGIMEGRSIAMVSVQLTSNARVSYSFLDHDQ